MKVYVSFTCRCGRSYLKTMREQILFWYEMTCDKCGRRLVSRDYFQTKKDWDAFDP